MPGGLAGDHVQAEDGIGLRILEHAFGHHQRRAAGFSGRRTFLRGLENELHGPGNSSRTPASASATPIRMAICASCPQACMTPTCCPRYSVFTVDLKGRSDSSDDRQCVHVSAQRYDGSRFAALEQADHTGFRHAGLDLHTELAQMIRDPVSPSYLAIRKLRILVDVTPPVDDLRFEAAYALVYGCREVLRRGGHWRRRSAKGQRWPRRRMDGLL